MSAPRPIAPNITPLVSQETPREGASKQPSGVQGWAADDGVSAEAFIKPPAAASVAGPVLPKPATTPRPAALMTLLRRGPVLEHRTSASLTTAEMEARSKEHGEAFMAGRTGR